MQSLRYKRKDSVLYKHKLLEHENEEVDFDMEIKGVFKYALTRQGDEAVQIHSRGNEELLKSKSEFNHPSIARIIVGKKKKYDYKRVSPGL